MVDRDFGLKVAESEIAAKQTLHESRNRVSYAASQTVFARRFNYAQQSVDCRGYLIEFALFERFSALWFEKTGRGRLNHFRRSAGSLNRGFTRSRAARSNNLSTG
jgi:hypothetical protein